jgi:hypothetical protein
MEAKLPVVIDVILLLFLFQLSPGSCLCDFLQCFRGGSTKKSQKAGDVARLQTYGIGKSVKRSITDLHRVVYQLMVEGAITEKVPLFFSLAFF